VLATAAKCITDVINSTGQINVDFADVCTVMRNGGVAILGNAACEGEDRAQRAIEEALNSPLLNDSEISGAKWILININSSEGEHEFTMDEVDIIQNHLLAQAGEHSDVILGLGYDNTLGNKLGITLIATGFEHRDPFTKRETPKPEAKQEDKIVMILGDEKPKKPQAQPAAQASKEAMDTLAPKLVDESAPVVAPSPLPAVEDEPFQMPYLQNMPPVAEKDPPVHLQLKTEKEEPSEMDREKRELDAKKQALNDKFEQLRQNILGNVPLQPKNPHQQPGYSGSASGGYLARPSNIYTEGKGETPASKPVDDAVPRPTAKSEEEETFDMQLVIRNDEPGTDVPATPQAQTPAAPKAEEPSKDKPEDEKRKAAERLQKLRNLSFNLNAADPNNEFEAVPAYIRRNLELGNNSSHVENFYSNYTVKPDGDNSAQISTINTFLEGKKPD
jgi:cell division protein FtsZ